MDYSTALGEFGARYTITWRGKEYPVAFITYRSKAAFEAWVKQGRMESARKLRDEGTFDAQEYEETRDKLLSDVKAGLYQFGGPLCLRELARPDASGFYQLFVILVREADPSLTEADVRQIIADEPDQVRDVVDLIRACLTERKDELEKKAAAASGPGPPKTSAITSPG